MQVLCVMPTLPGAKTQTCMCRMHRTSQQNCLRGRHLTERLVCMGVRKFLEAVVSLLKTVCVW